MCKTKDKYMAETMQLEKQISDQRKVIRALWIVTKAIEDELGNYDSYAHPSSECDSKDDKVCEAWEQSKTLEQFTEKILEGK